MARFDVVFEGGGAKGIAFAAALETIRNSGHDVGRVIGTSAGAITAALCAADYSPAEMVEVISERRGGRPRFLTFLDIPDPKGFTRAMRDQSAIMQILRSVDLPFVPDSMEERMEERLLEALLTNDGFLRLFSLVERGGLYSGETFLAWVEEKLAAKGSPPGETMLAFHQRTGSDLSVVVSDTTDSEMLVLNHRTAPSVPVAAAVRMSMSIPFVWQEVAWRRQWGSYLGREKTGHLIVDGGMLSNFPVRMFLAQDAYVKSIMGPATVRSSRTLGLLIDESIQVPGEERGITAHSLFSRFRFLERTSRLLDTMMASGDNAMIRRYAPLICRLPAAGYGTLEFDLTGPHLEHLLDAARAATIEHLTNRGFARPLAA